MTSPLRITFDVACPPDRAFDVWTSRIHMWWPHDHTLFGEEATVVLEAGVGGRIFERRADGDEHEWGRVTRWEPPTTLAYTWYLGRTPAEATEVTISFGGTGASTCVEIEHSGWERLGAEAGVWRDRNRMGWQTLLPHFAAAAQHDDGGR